MTIERIETVVGHVPASWRMETLEGISDFITKGGTPTTYGFDWASKDDGIPFFRSECVTDDGFNPKGMNYISAEAHLQMCRSEVKPGDLLMTITGNIGRVAKAPTEFESANINQHIARIRVVKDTVTSPSFVYQCLKHDGYATYYRTILTGQAYPQVSLQQVRETPLALPPLPEQQKIAAILTAVDDKLDIIARQIEATQTLKRGLMRTLFSRGVGAQDADGSWVAHTEFKDSELGEIPAGWQVERQGDVASFFNGRAYKLTEWEDEGTPVIRLQNLTGSGDKYYYSRLKLPPHQYANHGDLLYMWSATFGPYIWSGEKAIYHYHIWKVECGERLDKMFMYYSLFGLTDAMKGKTNGSAMAHITKAGMEKHSIVLPPLEEQERIGEILSSTDAKIDLLRTRQSQFLSLKRGLMQKLLSGEWRVKLDAEAVTA